MAIQDRIEKIKPFFIQFNIAAEDGAAYALVRFPNDKERWEMPTNALLKDNFKVEIGVRQEGVYFVSDLNDGVDCIFDAIDYVIEYNRSIQEKSGLLIEKIQELKQLFISEDIERLKTLEFVMKDKKKGGKTSRKTAKAEVVSISEEHSINDTEITEEKIEINDDNDLLSYAREIVE